MNQGRLQRCGPAQIRLCDAQDLVVRSPSSFEVSGTLPAPSDDGMLKPPSAKHRKQYFKSVKMTLL